MASFGRSARPKLIEPAGYASAARAELAGAIARRETARSYLGQLENNLSNLWGKLVTAETAVEDAKKALDATKQTVALQVVTGAKAEGKSVLDARAALSAAEDELDTLLAARKLSDPQKDQACEAIKDAERAVKQAAVLVIREHPQVAGMIDRMEVLQREYLKVAGAFNFLSNSNAVENMNESGFDLPDWRSKRARSAAYRTSQSPSSWHFTIGPEPVEFGSPSEEKAYDLLNQSAAPWVAALVALQDDANAPLPAAI